MERLEYLEIRNENREIIGIIDTAISIIWHRKFYGVGDFEIYAKETADHLSLLKRGYYVTRPDDDEIGIIELVKPHKSGTDGNVILASGRFGKAILDRRIIYNISGFRNTPTILQGNVESAVRQVVSSNAISCPFDSNRNIPILILGTSKGYTEIIVDETGAAAKKQAAGEVLLNFTDELLQEYKIASLIVLDDETKKLIYDIYKGADRSTDNTDGNEPIVFSTDFDNLNESTYTEDETEYKNAALIGGAGQDLDRFYYSIADAQKTGLQRREMFVDASSVNKKYTDENEQEHEYSDAEYKSIIATVAKQNLAALPVVESFTGEINTTFGQYVLNEDYFLGDLVTLQDNHLGKYATVRIMETTEVRDENGYSVSVEYENN